MKTNHQHNMIVKFERFFICGWPKIPGFEVQWWKAILVAHWMAKMGGRPLNWMALEIMAQTHSSRKKGSANAMRHDATCFVQNRDVTRSVGLEPQPLASHEASLATTLHNHMCPYSVYFLLILYLAEYKLLFKTLNDVKWKGCKLQSFIIFQDTTFMFAVSPFEVVYKIKKTAVAHNCCMAAACSLPWVMAVGLSAVAHGD
jgi:hypothetical protein